MYLTGNGIPTLDAGKTAAPIAATSGSALPGITLPANPYKYIATAGDSNTPDGPSLYVIDTSGNILIYPANGNRDGDPSSTPVKPTPIIAGTITGLS